MTPDKPKDEPWLTLPTRALVIAITSSAAVAAGGWAVVAFALGYSPEVAATGAIGAVLMGVMAIIGRLITFPWQPKPASTAMLAWVAADVLSMLATIAAAYVLYSATFMQIQPLLLGVVLAFFLTLFSQVAVAASHLNKDSP